MPEDRTPLNLLAWSIASILAGGGIIALLNYMSPIPLIELALWFTYVLIPLALLGFAVGLISWGTLTAMFNPGLRQRVNHYTGEMREERRARA